MNSEKNQNGFIHRLKYLIGEEKPYPWAARIGITQATFNRMWKEGVAPKADTLLLISEKTDCSIDWLLSGRGEMWQSNKTAVRDVVPGWEPTNGHPASKSTPPDGPDGYSDHERRFVLLRDVIEMYESMRPGREPDRKAREITIVYRHFMEHFECGLDEVEISEYINTWM